MTGSTVAAHPAKFTDSIQRVLAHLIEPHARWIARHGGIFDPFAGVGRVHDIARALKLPSLGFEIEHEWAEQDPRTIVADVLAPPMGAVMAWREETESRFTFPCGAIVTSPCYGNRLADNHVPRDACKACDGQGFRPREYPCRNCRGSGLSRRNTYTHTLGRALHEHNSGTLQWGDEYRRFHEQAWAVVVDLLGPHGWFWLNVSDHVRRGEVQRVSAWHSATLRNLGLIEQRRYVRVTTPRSRVGANGDVRVASERVYVFRKGNR